MQNYFIYTLLLTFCLAINTLSAQKVNEHKDFQERLVKESPIEYPEFLKLSGKVQVYRAGRLVSLDTFFEYAKDPNTIILDTRSVSDFMGRHIKGAVHLPFPKFNKESLEKAIGSKDKRILIYCNNNFTGDSKYMVTKMAPLALNIPTFINLYGYGYKNVYELKELVDVKDPRVEAKWEGIYGMNFKKSYEPSTP